MDSFDESEFGEAEADSGTEESALTEQAADAYVDGLTGDAEEEAAGLESDDYMGEVDRRLEVASYYRTLLRASLFTAATPSSRVVEREVRAFVKERLEILLSIRSEVKAPVQVVQRDFDDAEVAALKMVAARLIGKVSAAPQVAPAASPPAQVAPAVAPVPPPSAPATPKASPPPAAPKARTAPAPKTEVSTPRRPPGRPRRTPAPPQPSASHVPPTTQTVINAETGREVVVPKVQRPAGMVPFNTGPGGQEMISEMAARNRLSTQPVLAGAIANVVRSSDNQ